MDKCMIEKMKFYDLINVVEESILSRILRMSNSYRYATWYYEQAKTAFASFQRKRKRLKHFDKLDPFLSNMVICCSTEPPVSAVDY